MPIPRLTDRVKEAPAVVLRAVFAGIGQLLLAADKIRGRALGQFGQAGPAGQRERGEEAPGGTGAPAAPAPRPAAGPEPAAPPRPAAAPAPAAPPEPATARAPAAPPEPATAPEPTAPPKPATAPAAVAGTAAPEAAPGAALIPGYDDLSVASLRARLRVLDAPALRSLIDYERAHADRENVISMFQRRLAKITSETG